MAVLLNLIIVLADLSLGAWAYGYYFARPVRARSSTSDPGATPADWANSLGVFGLMLLLVVLMLMLTGWSPAL